MKFRRPDPRELTVASEMAIFGSLDRIRRIVSGIDPVVGSVRTGDRDQSAVPAFKESEFTRRTDRGRLRTSPSFHSEDSFEAWDVCNS